MISKTTEKPDAPKASTSTDTAASSSGAGKDLLLALLTEQQTFTVVDRFLRFLQLLYKSLVDIDIFGLGVKVLEVVHIVLGLSVQRLEGVWEHC